MIRSLSASVIAGAAMLASVGSATAQDAMWAAPTADNWTGFYIGAQTGLIGMKSHELGTAVPNGEALLGDIPPEIGGFAGFHYQATDWWVWGLDVEANYSNGEFFYNGSRFGNLIWDAAVRVQGGVPIAPNVLAYGSVGYSWASFDMTPYYDTAVPGSTGAAYIGSGFQLGFGVDAMITENVMARMQATWTHFGVHDIKDGGVTVATSEPSRINARIGLAFKF